MKRDLFPRHDCHATGVTSVRVRIFPRFPFPAFLNASLLVVFLFFYPFFLLRAGVRNEAGPRWASSADGIEAPAQSGQSIALPSSATADPSQPEPPPTRATDASTGGREAGSPVFTIPYLGSASAPVTILEFTDFECPFCGQMAPVLDEIVKSYPDKVRVIFKHCPLPFHAHAELAHEASVAAAAQGKFWEMYHLLFANQEHLEEADLLRYADELQLNLDTFRQVLRTHAYQPLVADSVAEANGLGVTATPTLFINGRRVGGAENFEALKLAVDRALGVETPAPAVREAKSGGQQQDSPVGQAPVRGSPQAPVSVVEFADFQCPFCAKVEGTLSQVLTEYPSGVKLVFKSFPLDFHRDSMLAHRAALAAGEQGKFWEMHDLILAQQRAIKRDDLMGMAKGLGLDMGRFATGLDSDRLLAMVEADRSEGAHLGVQGTPTFFVEGKELEGAATPAQFEQMIEGALLAKGIKPAQRFKTPVLDGGPTKGPEGAPVTILWYSDAASPLAPKAAQLIDQVLGAYPEKVRVVFKHRPLEFHPDAYLAHEALMAAGAQGKFWAMQDLILANQKALTEADLLSYARALGLNAQKFSDDLDRHVYRSQVQADISEAKKSGVFGVPVFFVNGQRVDGVQTLPAFKAIIDSHLQQSHMVAAR